MRKFNLLKIALLMTAALMLRCTDEPVAPREAEEDYGTSISAWSPSLFVIELRTVKSHPDHPLTEPIEFFLNGTSGRISVNWGDGTIQKFNLDGNRFSVSHQYDREKNYTIQVSGNVANITVVDIYYQHAIFNNLHLAGLTGLLDFGFGLNYITPATLNFSHNRKIEQLRLVGLKETSDVIVPTTNNLYVVDVAGENKIGTAVIDRIIARVYDSVKARPRAGSFELSKTWAQEPGTPDMVGPPSSYSMNKLRTLQNTYGWTIHPAP